MGCTASVVPPPPGTAVPESFMHDASKPAGNFQVAASSPEKPDVVAKSSVTDPPINKAKEEVQQPVSKAKAPAVAESKPVVASTPVSEPAPAPVSQPAAVPVSKPAPAPVSEPAAASVPKPAPAPVSEPAAASVPKPAPAPVPEPSPAPVSEPVPAPVSEPVAAPVPEPAPAPVALDAPKTESAPPSEDPKAEAAKIAPAPETSEPEGFRHTTVCIVGSGPAAYAAAIYTGRAEMKPIVFEGYMANGIAAGGQLMTSTIVENYPGFPDGILGPELTGNFRKQSQRMGVELIQETVESVDISSFPFIIRTKERTVTSEVLIVATGAVPRRLDFKGAGEGTKGFWNKGISANAICDGTSPLFHDKPVGVIGGGDSAVEAAVFLTKYASKVYLIHRRKTLRASKVMQRKVLTHEKIEILWESGVEEAYGNEEGNLGGIKVKHSKTKAISDLQVNGLFFAIGHSPATKFLQGQVHLDSDGYIVVKPGSTEASIHGVFAAGDVQDKKYQQAITAAMSGCMAGLEAEHYIAIGGYEGAEIRGVFPF